MIVSFQLMKLNWCRVGGFHRLHSLLFRFVSFKVTMRRTKSIESFVKRSKYWLEMRFCICFWITLNKCSTILFKVLSYLILYVKCTILFFLICLLPPLSHMYTLNRNPLLFCALFLCFHQWYQFLAALYVNHLQEKFSHI